MVPDHVVEDKKNVLNRPICIQNMLRGYQIKTRSGAIGVDGLSKLLSDIILINS